MSEVLDGIDEPSVVEMIARLGRMKDNLRQAMQSKPANNERTLRYG
jgi:hypothetical protein